MSTEDSIGLFSDIEKEIKHAARIQAEADARKFRAHLAAMLTDLGLDTGSFGSHYFVADATQAFEKERFSYVFELRKQAVLKKIISDSESLLADDQPSRSVNNT
ncbi:MAG: hypothetical protein CML16_03085 [Pusillimonas sp.]|nr:hypothetical protein [Pusillimonas sp.]MBC43572.1 hypothetical protein [Pusillimonas sp.]HCP78954.1 hypothetical protein [Pusillimonas sp.]